jgi:molybdate transport system ATP-binding protein
MSAISFQCRHRYASGFELDLAFEITSRFTSLFGPSGSGKTSVLSIIAGMLRPQQGCVRLDGRTLLDIASGVCLNPERRNVGVVFQDALLFPHLTVERNLQYGQRHRRRPRRTVTFAHVVETLELGPLLQRYPKNLSGGEKQRVSLGRALLSGPDLLMMDEPLASLDDPRKGRILAYLERAVADWNIPILFVTHNQAEVRRAAEWVVVIDNGRVVCAGTPNEALAQPGPLVWTDSTGPVNLLRISNIASADGRVTAAIGDQRLMLPVDQLPPVPPSFVQFRPADVILSREDVTGLSVRNHLRGRVCQVMAVGNAVFVAIDIGQILWAEVTPQAIAELQLAPDSQVVCLLKTQGLTLVP